MSAGTVTLQGTYYDGRRPVGVPATLVFADHEARLIGAMLTLRHPTRTLLVSPRVAGADRFIVLPDGGQFQCADHAVLRRLPQESRSEGLAAWLEARVSVALAGVVAIVALLLFGYFYGLPAAAERIVRHIPIETEQGLGREVLGWLDQNEWLKASTIDEDVQFFIRQEFDALRAGLPHAQHYRLEFRQSFVGANAFAFPGGIIVVTDDMVRLGTVDEVTAVLAHEIGHVEHRHAMRGLLQDSLIAAAATAITADAASLSVAVAGLPALLAQSKYSRDFETQADDFAFRLLKERGRSPEAFATLMEKLNADSDEAHDFAFLSSHPITLQRIERARAAAQP